MPQAALSSGARTRRIERGSRACSRGTPVPSPDLHERQLIHAKPALHGRRISKRKMPRLKAAIMGGARSRGNQRASAINTTEFQKLRA